MNTDTLLHTDEKTLLRFITCGSVDDGKSTLIGRLLYDSKALFDDKLGSLSSESKKYGTTGEELDLALVVDGLQAEREQGITIDVAYLFFETDARKYIIADTPGHEQYTRNMATGASTADAAIILIDARKGVLTQTRRHAFIANLLGIKHLIVAVNKMDMVGYDAAVFADIRQAFERDIADKLVLQDVTFIPISALKGDNIVSKSDNMHWYSGETLIHILDTVPSTTYGECGFRFPVQYVNRPSLHFRGFCGSVASGTITAGDEVIVLPAGKKTHIKEVILPATAEHPCTSHVCHTSQSVTITTTDEIDISRGDMISCLEDIPFAAHALEGTIIWMDDDAAVTSRRYGFKFATKRTAGTIDTLLHTLDVETYDKKEARELRLNDIGLCHISLEEKVVFDSYTHNRATGSFIVIDLLTHKTVGAGLVHHALNQQATKSEYSTFEIELNALIRKHFPHWESNIIQ